MANVISICGSLRKGSCDNRMVMNLLSELAPSEMIIKEAPSFAEFPLYKADIQNSTGFPDAVIDARRRDPRRRWRHFLRRQNTTSRCRATLKNAIDWVSRRQTSRLRASRSRSNPPRPVLSAAGAFNMICAARWCSGRIDPEQAGDLHRQLRVQVR